MNRETPLLPILARRCSLADLFDQAGRLRPFTDLPPDLAAEIASFDVVWMTTRTEGETVITEELIRVKTRDRRTAEVSTRGGASMTARTLRVTPLRRRVVTVRERSAGRGRTAAAEAAGCERVKSDIKGTRGPEGEKDEPESVVW